MYLDILSRFIIYFVCFCQNCSSYGQHAINYILVAHALIRSSSVHELSDRKANEIYNESAQNIQVRCAYRFKCMTVYVYTATASKGLKTFGEYARSVSFRQVNSEIKFINIVNIAAENLSNSLSRKLCLQVEGIYRLKTIVFYLRMASKRMCRILIISYICFR